MVTSIRAVYTDGQLRPLEPLNLAEGETVDITIVSPAQPLTAEIADARLCVAGLLMQFEPTEGLEELPPDELERIGRLFVGARPSHELIDEDRN